jgi:hypothetical protein
MPEGFLIQKFKKQRRSSMRPLVLTVSILQWLYHDIYLYITEATQEVGIAFLVPYSKLDRLLKLHHPSEAFHNIILTIPIADRVATIVISISREDAIRFSYEFTLPVIFNSNPPCM